MWIPCCKQSCLYPSSARMHHRAPRKYSRARRKPGREAENACGLRIGMQDITSGSESGDSDPADQAGVTELSHSGVDDPARASLRAHAKSLGHLLTRKLALPRHCESCMRGKTGIIKKFAGRSQRSPIKFCDLVTIGHIHIRDRRGRVGVGGFDYYRGIHYFWGVAAEAIGIGTQ